MKLKSNLGLNRPRFSRYNEDSRKYQQLPSQYPDGIVILIDRHQEN
ncbi:MAG: hypothetical protein ACJA2O_001881 [Candidatus Azotimanducaceae bacterium]|jgi:hypothetical protein